MDTSLLKEYEKLQTAASTRQEKISKLNQELRALNDDHTALLAEDVESKKQEVVMEMQLATQIRDCSKGKLCLMRTDEKCARDIVTMEHKWTYQEILDVLKIHKVVFFTKEVKFRRSRRVPVAFHLFPTADSPHHQTDIVLAASMNVLQQLVSAQQDGIFNMLSVRADGLHDANIQVQFPGSAKLYSGRFLPTIVCSTERCNFCKAGVALFGFLGSYFANAELCIQKRCAEFETPDGKRHKSNDDDDSLLDD